MKKRSPGRFRKVQLLMKSGGGRRSGGGKWSGGGVGFSVAFGPYLFLFFVLGLG